MAGIVAAIHSKNRCRSAAISPRTGYNYLLRGDISLGSSDIVRSETRQLSDVDRLTRQQMTNSEHRR